MRCEKHTEKKVNFLLNNKTLPLRNIFDCACQQILLGLLTKINNFFLAILERKCDMRDNGSLE